MGLSRGFSRGMLVQDGVGRRGRGGVCDEGKELVALSLYTFTPLQLPTRLLSSI
jgi:hypothetical protein